MPAAVLWCILCCSLFMGNLELPGAATGSKQMLKVPIGTYEFGANLISEKGVSVWLLYAASVEYRVVIAAVGTD